VTRPTAFVPVTVECHAGARADETPRAVTIAGRRHEVLEVQDRWHDAGRTRDLAVRRIFKVRLDTGETVFLEQDEGTGAWTLRAPLRISLE
jgi:hypothetical protein